MCVSLFKHVQQERGQKRSDLQNPSRAAIYSQLLETSFFSLSLINTGPQWALHSGTVKPQAAWAGMSSLPAPLARAAHHGNPSACGLIAQLLEVSRIL